MTDRELLTPGTQHIVMDPVLCFRIQARTK